MPSPEKPSQHIKQLLTNTPDSSTNKSSNACTKNMLNDIAKRLTINETKNYVREFIEYQKQQKNK